MITNEDHPKKLSPPRKQRRPGPANPNHAVPRSEWPEILHRIERGEACRQIAQSYTGQGHNVSYQSIYRIVRSLCKQQRGGQASMARRGRKYSLCLRVTTQDVEDFFVSEWGRTILVNSSMKFLMKQDSTTIDAVTRAFKLSDGERKFLTSCAKGEGLFFVRGSHVPMKVVASPLEHQLATTNPQELLEEELATMAKEAKQVGMALALPADEDHQYDIVLPEFWSN